MKIRHENKEKKAKRREKMETQCPNCRIEVAGKVCSNCGTCISCG